MKTKYYIKNLEFIQDKQKQLISIDSLLIEKYINININSKKILEVGSGCGIISLLLAKRTTAHIDSIDIDLDQINISKQNFELNKNKIRTKSINFIHCDFKEYLKEENNYYDIIFSNPPYFKKVDINQMKKNSNLVNSRNEVLITFEELFLNAKRLLKNNGKFYIILRADRIDEIIYLGILNKMYVNKICFVYTKKNLAKFVLVECIKNSNLGVKVNLPILLYEKYIYNSYYEDSSIDSENS